MEFSSENHFSKNSKVPDEKVVQEWVAAAQDGDMDAFGKLYDAYIDVVYRYVYYRVDKSEVEDLVESIFVRVWENIDKYKPGSHPFSSWLFRVAHNLVVDHYRFYRKHISLHENLPDHLHQSDDNPMEWADKRLNQKHLHEALGELKESYQQVLILKYLVGLSNEEVAQVLQCKVPNVRILQYRALRALRQIFEARGIDCND